MSQQQPRIPESVVQTAYPRSTLTFIGRGGQSDVWRAQSAGADEALRIIVTGDGARLAQEVAALQRLSSPYLMRFHALESLRYQGDDLAVVRGEFIDGGTVADRIIAGALPSEREALECIAGVLEALALLQDADLIHRDVKPQNIALRGGDWAQPVLLDLGYVRAVTATSLTVYPNHIGTLEYMAPEQLRRDPAKMRSDVFALGLVFFELLTGERPFLKIGERLLITDLIDRMIDPAWPDANLKTKIASAIRPLILEMLSASPHDRPSVGRALKEVRALLVAQT